MVMKCAPFYWVECDSCGELADYGDFAAMAHEEDAEEAALGDDWTMALGKHHCSECPRLAVCPDCSATVSGHAARERDDRCPRCWKTLQAKRHARRQPPLAAP